MDTEILNCPDFQILRPDEAVAEGCPVLTKMRHITAHKGVQGIVEWTLRKPDGSAVDLSDYFCPYGYEISLSLANETNPCEDGTVIVRLISCDEDRRTLKEIAGVVTVPSAGTIRFRLTDDMVNYAGIYRMEIGVTDHADKLIFTDRGLVSVERGLFGNTEDMRGPPTLSEIRMALRDSVVENNLLDAVEFTSDEIVFSIVRPIAEWNEMPPHVAHYTCHNFPYKEMWLKGIIAQLLQTAAFHYTRNKMPSSHGGLTVDDKNKDREYLMLAGAFREEWRNWMLTEKVRINIRIGRGGIGSIYGGYLGGTTW